MDRDERLAVAERMEREGYDKIAALLRHGGTLSFSAEGAHYSPLRLPTK